MLKPRRLSIALAIICALGGLFVWQGTNIGLDGQGGEPKAEQRAGAPVDRAGPQPQPVRAAADSRWSVGQRYEYSLEMSSELQLGEANAAAMGFVLKGRWTATVLPPEGAGTRLMAQIMDADYRLTVVDPADPEQARAVQRRISQDVGRPHVVSLDQEGRVTEVALPEGMHAQGQMALKALTDGIQFVQPQAADRQWELTETGSTGVYVARYDMTADASRASKYKLKYLEVSVAGNAAMDDLQAEVVHSDGVFGFRQDRTLTSVQVAETVKVSGSDMFTGGQSETRISMNLDRVQDVGGALAQINQQASRLDGRALNSGLDGRTRRDIIDQSKIAGLEFKQVLALLDAHPGAGKQDRQARYRTFLVMEALLRQQPEAVKEARAHVAAGGTHSEFMVQALGYAGTEGAQTILRELVTDKSLSLDDRSKALVALHNAGEPSVKTINLHEDLLDDESFSGQAHMGLGALARKAMANKQPELAEHAVQTLLGRLDSAEGPKELKLVLRAISNAGHPASMPLLSKYAGHESPLVRSAAVDATRLVDNEEAAALALDRALNDEDQSVRKAALRAFRKRTPSPAVVAGLDRLVRDEQSAAVRYEAVQLLASARIPAGATRPTMQWLVDNETDDKIRKLAQQALGI